MKNILFISGLFLFTTCNNQSGTHITHNPLNGTWKLLTGTLVEKGDSTTTDYTTGKSFIKIINDDHFSFVLHDLQHGKDSAKAVYSSGAGRYTLVNDLYTEHLEYCSDREWEAHDFSFTITIRGDTLIQRGYEKVDSAGIDRLNIEKYIKL